MGSFRCILPLCSAVMCAAEASPAFAAVHVGLATPMDKVMIHGAAHGWPFEGWVADHYDLAMAQNEHEGFQVVV